MDTGAILLPKELREFAGLERQALLIGQGNTFELWDEKRWNEQRDEWLATDDGDKRAYLKNSIAVAIAPRRDADG